jgi:hypothetical protein
MRLLSATTVAAVSFCLSQLIEKNGRKGKKT